MITTDGFKRVVTPKAVFVAILALLMFAVTAQGALAVDTYVENPSSYAFIDEGYPNYMRFYANYTVPVDVTAASWQIKRGMYSTANVTVPNSCYSGSVLQFKYEMGQDSDNAGVPLQSAGGYCYNGTGWETIVAQETTNQTTSCLINCLEPFNLTVDGDYATGTYMDADITGTNGVTCDETGYGCSVVQLYEEGVWWTTQSAGANITYSNFNGATTNFSNGSSTFSQPVLENTTYGKVVWNGSDLNFTNANFDAYAFYGSNLIGFDTANLPAGVNTSAAVSIYGSYTGWKNPYVLKDGAACGAGCTGLVTNSSGAYFTVSGFSNYSIANGTACSATITGCCLLTSSGTYTLGNDITETIPDTDSCLFFNTTGLNVTINGAGYKLAPLNGSALANMNFFTSTYNNRSDITLQNMLVNCTNTRRNFGDRVTEAACIQLSGGSLSLSNMTMYHINSTSGYNSTGSSTIIPYLIAIHGNENVSVVDSSLNARGVTIWVNGTSEFTFSNASVNALSYSTSVPAISARTGSTQVSVTDSVFTTGLSSVSGGNVVLNANVTRSRVGIGQIFVTGYLNVVNSTLRGSLGDGGLGTSGAYYNFMNSNLTGLPFLGTKNLNATNSFFNFSNIVGGTTPTCNSALIIWDQLINNTMYFYEYVTSNGGSTGMTGLENISHNVMHMMSPNGSFGDCNAFGLSGSIDENYWMNDALTGWSDTCTNDGTGHCVEKPYDVFNNTLAYDNNPLTFNAPAAQSVNLTNGLDACYPMGSTANVLPGLSLTAVNTPVYQTGKIGDAAYLNNAAFMIGEDRYDLATTPNLTIAFWMKVNPSMQSYLYSKWHGSSGNRAYESYFTGANGTMVFRTSSSGEGATATHTSNQTILFDNSTWYYVVSVYNQNGTHTVYVNDVPHSGTLDTSVWNNSQWFSIACESTGTPGNDCDPSFANITVDEYAFWNRSLNAAEASQLYNSSSGMSCYAIANVTEPVTDPLGTDGFEDGDYTNNPLWSAQYDTTDWSVIATQTPQGSYALNFSPDGDNQPEYLRSPIVAGKTLEVGDSFGGWMKRTAGIADMIVRVVFDDATMLETVNWPVFGAQKFVWACGGSFQTGNQIAAPYGSWYNWNWTYLGAGQWNYTIRNETGNIIGSNNASCTVGQKPTYIELKYYDSSDPSYGGLMTDAITYPYSLVSGQTHHWNLNNVLTDGVGNITLENQGASFTTEYPSYNSSGSGSTHSIYFNGSTFLNGTNPIIGGTNFTVSLWVKLSNTTTYPFRYFTTGKYNSPTDRGVDFGQQSGDGKTTFCYAGTQSAGSFDQCVVSTNTISNGTWHHVVGVRNGTNAYLYIDGVLNANSSTGTMNETRAPSSNNMVVGAWYSGGYGLFMNGSLDELKTYNVALSAAQVNNLYNCGQTSTCPIYYAPMYFSFDDTPNDTWSGFAGNVSAGIAYSTDVPILGNGTAVSGKSANFSGNGALLVDGHDDVLSVPNNFTVSYWAKKDSTTGYFMFANRYSDGAGNYGGFSAWTYDGVGYTGLNFDTLFNLTGEELLIGQTGYTADGLWHHWVLSKSAVEGMKVYRDGMLVMSNSSYTTDVTYVASKTGFGIGNSQASRAGFPTVGFNGLMDEFKFYPRVLNTTEVDNLYECNNETVCVDYNLKQYNDFGDTSQYYLDYDNQRASGFKVVANSTYLLNRVEVLLGTFSSGTPTCGLNLSIYTGNGSQPTSKLASFGTIANTALVASDWNTVTNATGFTFTNGTEYWIVPEASVSCPVSYYHLRSKPETAASVFAIANSGMTWTAVDTNSGMWRTYGIEPPVPPAYVSNYSLARDVNYIWYDDFNRGDGAISRSDNLTRNSTSGNLWRLARDNASYTPNFTAEISSGMLKFTSDAMYDATSFVTEEFSTADASGASHVALNPSQYFNEGAYEVDVVMYNTSSWGAPSGNINRIYPLVGGFKDGYRCRYQTYNAAGSNTPTIFGITNSQVINPHTGAGGGAALSYVVDGNTYHHLIQYNASANQCRMRLNGTFTTGYQVFDSGWVAAGTTTFPQDDYVAGFVSNVTNAGFYTYFDNFKIYGGLVDPEIKYATYDGGTSGFMTNASFSNWSALSQPVLEKTSYGRVKWSGSALDFRTADFDANGYFAPNLVGFNTAGLPAAVNTSANVTIYGDYSTWMNPIVLKDGVACGVSCTGVTINGSGAYFTVASFSNYTIGNATYDIQNQLGNVKYHFPFETTLMESQGRVSAGADTSLVYSTGVVGLSVSQNANGDVGTWSNESAFRIPSGTNFTMQFWMKDTSPNANLDYIFQVGTDGGGDSKYILYQYVSGGNNTIALSWRTVSGVENQFYCGRTLDASFGLYTFVVSRNSSGDYASCYYNGTLHTSQVLTASYASDIAPKSVVYLFPSTGGTDTLTTDIDELMLFNTSLAQGEILSYFNDSASFDPPPAGGIAVSYPVQYTTIAKKNATVGDIVMAGTYSGSIASIDARFNGGSWMTVNSSISGGVWSGVLSNQPLGQGVLEVRNTANASVNASVANVSIGNLYLVSLSQSNAIGYSTGSNQSLNSSNPYVATMYKNGVWSVLTDPTGNWSDSYGSAWPLVANNLTQTLNEPFGLINAGIPGSSTLEWDSATSGYQNMIAYVGAATNGVKRVTSVLIDIGETDAKIASTISGDYTKFKGNLSLIINNTAASLNVTNGFFVALTGEMADPANPTSRDRLDNIRKAQMDLWDEDEKVYPGPVTLGISKNDVNKLHYNGTQNMADLARLWSAVLLQQRGVVDGQSPKMTNVTQSGSVIHVLFDENISTGSGNHGFYVYSSTQNYSVSSSSYTGNDLTLNMNQTLSTSVNVSLMSYNDGAGADTVNDTNMNPARPFYNYVTIAKSLTLVSPANNTQVTTVNTDFTFNITDGNGTETCDLLIDGVVRNSSSGLGDGSYFKRAPQYLIDNNYDGDMHNWSVQCGALASETRLFTVKDTAYPFIIDQCRVLQSGGSYVLKQNLTYPYPLYTGFYANQGLCVYVNTSQPASIDCLGNKLTGVGNASTSWGVFSPSGSPLNVSNCVMSGHRYVGNDLAGGDLYLDSGGSSTRSYVSNNTFRSRTTLEGSCNIIYLTAFNNSFNPETYSASNGLYYRAAYTHGSVQFIGNVFNVSQVGSPSCGGGNYWLLENNTFVNTNQLQWAYESNGGNVTYIGNHFRNVLFYGGFFSSTAPDQTFVNNIMNNTLFGEAENGAKVSLNGSVFNQTNIVGRSQWGGNYWTNSTGGFSDTCLNQNNDSFCDSSYYIYNPYGSGSNGTDYYPLTLNGPIPIVSLVSPANGTQLSSVYNSSPWNSSYSTSWNSNAGSIAFGQSFIAQGDLLTDVYSTVSWATTYHYKVYIGNGTSGTVIADGTFYKPAFGEGREPLSSAVSLIPGNWYTFEIYSADAGNVYLDRHWVFSGGGMNKQPGDGYLAGVAQAFDYVFDWTFRNATRFTFNTTLINGMCSLYLDGSNRANLSVTADGQYSLFDPQYLINNNYDGYTHNWSVSCTQANSTTTRQWTVRDTAYDYYVDFCPRNGDQAGRYVMWQNLTCGGGGLSTSVSNAEIDCRGYTLFTSGAGQDGGGTAPGASNQTIRNCNFQMSGNQYTFTPRGINTRLINNSWRGTATYGFATSPISYLYVEDNYFGFTAAGSWYIDSALTQLYTFDRNVWNLSGNAVGQCLNVVDNARNNTFYKGNFCAYGSSVNGSYSGNRFYDPAGLIYVTSPWTNPVTVYNNFFNTTNQYFIYFENASSYAKLNTTQQSGTNVIGGSYLGGNYYSRPNGTGFSEMCFDYMRDGICDAAYDPSNAGFGGYDYLPLTYPRACYGNESSLILPVNGSSSVSMIGNITFQVNVGTYDLVWLYNDGNLLLDGVNASAYAYANVTTEGQHNVTLVMQDVSACSGNTTLEYSYNWSRPVCGANISACCVITSPGTYNVVADINETVPASDFCIYIRTDGNVTIDGNGNTVVVGGGAGITNAGYTNNVTASGLSLECQDIDNGASSGACIYFQNGGVMSLQDVHILNPTTGFNVATYGFIFDTSNELNVLMDGGSFFGRSWIYTYAPSMTAYDVRNYVSNISGNGFYYMFDGSLDMSMYMENFSHYGGSSTDWGYYADVPTFVVNNSYFDSGAAWGNMIGSTGGDGYWFYNSTLKNQSMADGYGAPMVNFIESNFEGVFTSNAATGLRLNATRSVFSLNQLNQLITWDQFVDNTIYMYSTSQVSVYNFFGGENFTQNKVYLNGSTFNYYALSGVMDENYWFGVNETTGWSGNCTNDGTGHCMEKPYDIFGDASMFDNAPLTLNEVPTTVTLLSPANNSIVTTPSENFTFNIYFALNETCNLTIDGVTRNSTAANVDGNYSLQAASYLYSINYDGLYHNWSVQCTHASSEVFNFTVQDNSVLVLSNESCPTITYPNEKNQPNKAFIPVNFSVFRPAGFTTPDILVNLTLGSHEASATETDCGYVQLDTKNRNYQCNVSMEYHYPAGNWNVAIYFQDDGGTATFSNASMCQYGQLIAYQRSTGTVNFPTAAPDVDNAPGDRPIIVENTGNMPLSLFMTGYDLVGNINPGATLSAMHFNVGQNLTASVEMQNGVQKNLSTYLPPGESSNATIYMWLSMPYGQTVQDYVPSQQWELAGLST